MEYKKERNFIVAYDSDIMCGKWNIITGEFIGKSGKVVKGVPHAFTFTVLPTYTLERSNSDILGYTIRKFREFDINAYTIERGNRMEQLVSVGLYPVWLCDLDDTVRLNASLVKFLKDTYMSRYDSFYVRQYLASMKYQELLEDKPKWYKDVFYQVIATDLPYDYIKAILNRCLTEKVDCFFPMTQTSLVYGIENIVKKYYEYSMTLYGSVKVTPNVLSNMGYLSSLYDTWKNKHYDEFLLKNNNCSWLYYEDDDYIIKPLLTREDFHYEAEKQHNCVERLYMDKVAEGKTHVVAVRLREEPDTPYITCEVSKYGEIIQYLLAFNNHPKEYSDCLLKKQYQEHLNKKMAK